MGASGQARFARPLLVGGGLSLIVGTLLVSASAIETINAMTSSYAYAESRWSKAQKVSLIHAERFLRTGDEDDRAAAIEALAILEAFRAAREAMVAPQLDFEAAARALGAAGVDASEHWLMIWGPQVLDVGALREASSIWATADRMIADYRAWLDDIDGDETRDREAMGRQLRTFDRDITVLEHRFSGRLRGLEASAAAWGQGMRWGIGLALVGAGTFLFMRHLRRLERQRERLDAQAVELLRFREAVDQVPDGVGLIDERFRTAYSNPARDALFGRTAEEINQLGGSIQLMAMPDGMRHRLMAREPASGDVRIIRPDGTERVAVLRATPLYREGGRFAGFIGLFSDVTDRRKDEERERQRTEELREAKERAESATRAKSRFLAAMSHEIRTPMNAVLGLATLLLDSELDDEQRNLLRTLQQSGEGLLDILNGILDFSKIESGQLVLETIPFDPARLLREVAELLGPMAVEKGLELRTVVGEGVPAAVSGDPTRLRQVLVNLVGNALKFTPAGSTTIRLGVEQQTSEEVTLRCEVEDTGIGLGAGVADRLFRPFRQADDSTTRRFGGTGLGLAICRELVTAMGGAIQAESRGEGQGTTFSFTTRHRRAELESAPAVDDAALDGAPLRLLVAEDNPVNQKVVAGFLSRIGCRFDVVDDGAQVLELLRTESVDVILMDVQMPVLDGLEATRRLRAMLDPERQPHVIALTANAFAEDEAACLAAGMDAFLRKPLRRQDLVRALSDARKARAARRLPSASSPLPDSTPCG